jgi:hypothetical protein
VQDRRAPTQCTDDTTFDHTKNENKNNTVFAKPKFSGIPGNLRKRPAWDYRLTAKFRI